MPTQPERPKGLRERKKIKLHRTIQSEALRLFETQGYEQTTVEQIAEAAETSTTTFYRLFPTKEDVVLDRDKHVLVDTLLTSPAGDENLTDTVRAALVATSAEVEADRDHNLTRLRLIAAVPALQARYAGDERSSIDLLAGLLAQRTERAPDDYQVELTAAALAAVLFTASRRWASEHAHTTLAALTDQAITMIEPILAALDESSEASRKQ